MRSSWAANHTNVRFVIGSNTTGEAPDVVSVAAPDGYSHLAVKLRDGYRWATQHTNADWILKVDDDCYVDVDQATAFFARKRPRWTVMAAGFERNGRPNKSGKYVDLKYPDAVYKPYPQGAGHAVSKDIAKWVARHSSLPFYPGEDTSLGSWVSVAPVSTALVADSHFVPWNERPCSDKRAFVVSHNFSPLAMARCHRLREKHR